MNTNITQIYDYGVFTPVINGNSITIRTSDINESNIDDYVNDLKMYS